MILVMKKPRPLPDLSKLSSAEKDRLILSLHARVRAEQAKLAALEAEESARLLAEFPQFLAGEANKTPAKLGDVGE